MNLARFGLIKNDNGAIESEGASTLVEVPEREALSQNSANIYKYDSPQELSSRASYLGAKLSPGLWAQLYSDVVCQGPDSIHVPPPIPPKRKRKYVKHEKKTSKAYIEKAKEKLGIVDFDKPVLKEKDKALHFALNSEEVLSLFPKEKNPEKLDKNVFARNIVWEIYKLSQSGKPPEFMLEGCNMRTIFYLFKPALTVNKIFTDNTEKTKKEKSQDEGDIDSFYGNFTRAVQTLVLEGLISYRDLYIDDDRKPFRFLPPARFNTHILLLAEKRSNLGRFLTLASKYGVMAQITRGKSTYLMADTMLTEMYELEYDFSKNLNILSFCDFDPVGSYIPFHFVKHLRQLGFHNVNSFEQYGDKVHRVDTGEKYANGRKKYVKVHQRRECLDIVNPHDFDAETRQRMRHVLKASQRDDLQTVKWTRMTGGVTGTCRNTKYGISAEQFLPYVNDELDKKIKPLLDIPPEEVGLSSSLKVLSRALQRHIGIRAFLKAQELRS